MKEYFYEINLHWDSNKTGALTSQGMQEIEVNSIQTTPLEKKETWSSEHLLGAALSSCFMHTFLEIAKLSKLEMLEYQSQCFVKLEKKEGKYITTEILLRPIIQLTNQLYMPRALKCTEEADKSCPLKNSLNLNIEIYPKFEYPNAVK